MTPTILKKPCTDCLKEQTEETDASTKKLCQVCSQKRLDKKVRFDDPQQESKPVTKSEELTKKLHKSCSCIGKLQSTRIDAGPSLTGKSSPAADKSTSEAISERGEKNLSQKTREIKSESVIGQDIKEDDLEAKIVIRGSDDSTTVKVTHKVCICKKKTPDGVQVQITAKRLPNETVGSSEECKSNKINREQNAAESVRSHEKNEDKEIHDEETAKLIPKRVCSNKDCRSKKMVQQPEGRKSVTLKKIEEEKVEKEKETKPEFLKNVVCSNKECKRKNLSERTKADESPCFKENKQDQQRDGITRIVPMKKVCSNVECKVKKFIEERSDGKTDSKDKGEDAEKQQEVFSKISPKKIVCSNKDCKFKKATEGEKDVGGYGESQKIKSTFSPDKKLHPITDKTEETNEAGASELTDVTKERKSVDSQSPKAGESEKFAVDGLDSVQKEVVSVASSIQKPSKLAVEEDKSVKSTSKSDDIESKIISIMSDTKKSSLLDEKISGMEGGSIPGIVEYLLEQLKLSVEDETTNPEDEREVTEGILNYLLDHLKSGDGPSENMADFISEATKVVGEPCEEESDAIKGILDSLLEQLKTKAEDELETEMINITDILNYILEQMQDGDGADGTAADDILTFILDHIGMNVLPETDELSVGLRILINEIIDKLIGPAAENRLWKLQMIAKQEKERKEMGECVYPLWKEAVDCMLTIDEEEACDTSNDAPLILSGTELQKSFDSAAYKFCECPQAELFDMETPYGERMRAVYKRSSAYSWMSECGDVIDYTLKMLKHNKESLVKEYGAEVEDDLKFIEQAWTHLKDEIKRNAHWKMLDGTTVEKIIAETILEDFMQGPEAAECSVQEDCSAEAFHHYLYTPERPEVEPDLPDPPSVPPTPPTTPESSVSHQEEINCLGITVTAVGDGPDTDEELWNRFVISYRSKPWHVAVWLYAECYFYRRLYADIQQTKCLQSLDPYRFQKRAALVDAMPHMMTLISKVLDQSGEEDVVPAWAIEQDKKEQFNIFLQASLWGNKFNIVKDNGIRMETKGDALHLLSQFYKNILVNNSDQVWRQLHKRGLSGPVDIILNDGGCEVICDLCLADFLITSKLTLQVRLHAKAIPFLITDVTRGDIVFLLQVLCTSKERNLQKLYKRWEEFFTEGKWVLHNEWFWTLPYEFPVMPVIDMKLYVDLSLSSLIIFKGDMNYRKLVSEINWYPACPFSDALKTFHPAPLVALRVIKSDAVCGLPLGVAEKLQERQGDQWKSRGQYGVILYDDTQWREWRMCCNCLSDELGSSLLLCPVSSSHFTCPCV